MKKGQLNNSLVKNSEKRQVEQQLNSSGHKSSTDEKSQI